jgi:hypothetical protein
MFFVFPVQQVLSDVQDLPETFLHFFFLCFLPSASGAGRSAALPMPAATSAVSALRRVPARVTIWLSLSNVDPSKMVLHPVQHV